MAALVAIAALVLAGWGAGLARAEGAGPASRAAAGAAPRVAAAAVKRRGPRQLGPANDARVAAVPSFSWAPVPGAKRYEFQMAADAGFESIVAGQGRGSFQTANTFATVDKTLADGRYFWRVRALDARDRASRWSPVRSITKGWRSVPALLAPANFGAVQYPTTPLVLRWSPVPYAFKYSVRIATDPSLGHSALGARTQVVETSATSFAPPDALGPGRYYWAVTPLDAAKHPGSRSAVGAFDVTWPTGTRGVQRDANGDPGFNDPAFSWNPVLGAAEYEVEVSHDEQFAAGAKVCCAERVTGSSYAPRSVLPNNRYHWRLRAIDAAGNAGQWHPQGSFTKGFDPVVDPSSGTPATVTGLRMERHPSDPAAAPATAAPIVRWNPVPTAASYEVQVVPRTIDGCNWTASPLFKVDVVTAATAWTPLSPTWNQAKPGGISYPRVASDRAALTSGTAYCVRVAAQSDRDALGRRVVSDWTELGGAGSAAFTYQAPTPAPATPLRPLAASDYLTPQTGSTTERLPVFTWTPVEGAGSYFVVVAKDAAFTEIRDLALSRVPAYAPRNGIDPWTYPDETTPYFWAVIPARGTNGDGAPYSPVGSSPQPFVKNSASPVPLAPAAGSDVAGQPTFAWTGAEGARNYTVQIAANESFANPIDTVTTASTTFTSVASYPADTVLFWRVRANDENKVGLRWSETRTFRRRLPVPAPSPANPLAGEAIPALSWSPVPGAVSYDMHVEQADGTKRNFTMRSTAFTPLAFYGTGVWRWQVRANFKAGFQHVSGGFSGLTPFARRIATPAGARTTRARRGILLGWNPTSQARQYRVQVSTSEAFTSLVENVMTENTGYAPRMNHQAFRSGGPLFWRVATVDEGLNVGGYATSVLRQGRAMGVRVSGRLRRGRAGVVRVTVRDARRRAVAGARVQVEGAGVRMRPRRTGRRGTVSLRVRPTRRGTVTFKVDRRGYSPASGRVRVR